jgi:hypothetical protein
MIMSAVWPASTSASAPPSTPIRTGLNSRMYGTQHLEVGLVVVAAHHDEAVPLGDLRGDLGTPTPSRSRSRSCLRYSIVFGGERLQLHGQALAGVGHGLGHTLAVLAHAVRHRARRPP